jgi:hypothetical protein
MMRQLCSDYFARSPFLMFPMLALGLFVLVFVAVSVRALLARRDDVDRLAALPLSDSEEPRHV